MKRRNDQAKFTLLTFEKNKSIKRHNHRQDEIGLELRDMHVHRLRENATHMMGRVTCGDSWSMEIFIPTGEPYQVGIGSSIYSQLQ